MEETPLLFSTSAQKVPPHQGILDPSLAGTIGFERCRAGMFLVPTVSIATPAKCGLSLSSSVHRSNKREAVEGRSRPRLSQVYKLKIISLITLTRPDNGISKIIDENTFFNVHAGVSGTLDWEGRIQLSRVKRQIVIVANTDSTCLQCALRKYLDYCRKAEFQKIRR